MQVDKDKILIKNFSLFQYLSVLTFESLEKIKIEIRFCLHCIEIKDDDCTQRIFKNIKLTRIISKAHFVPMITTECKEFKKLGDISIIYIEE